MHTLLTGDALRWWYSVRDHYDTVLKLPLDEIAIIQMWRENYQPEYVRRQSVARTTLFDGLCTVVQHPTVLY